MKDKVFGVLQRVGRSFMLPIALLPVAGLFLGIGGAFTNATMLEAYGLTKIMGPGTIINSILLVMNDAGNIVFANLPLLFAMGVAIGMAKKEKEVAALSAVVAFFIMHASIGAMITINNAAETMPAGTIGSVCGIRSLEMGVFGGIIVGLGVAALHNRFYKIELPPVLSFFGGTRFVPIVSATVYLIVGILMYFAWPPVQLAMYKLGDLVNASGYAGTWIYGIIERALIPFGLHHVFYMPFWQTSVGGSMEIQGVLVQGAQNIFFAELADPATTQFSVSATRFMSGKFPMMIFGLPGAALAMYKCAKPEKKQVAGGLLMSAALTAMLTGITEPLEFTFIFVAPLMYGVHCVFAGLAYMLMHIFNVGVGMTFSGGIIDLTLFGILQGNAKTNWIWVVIVGVVYFVVYYFVFGFMIKHFNYQTPGREEGDEEVKLYTRADVNARKDGSGAGGASDDPISPLILQGLGGKGNISDVDCCATRLRITVKDSSKVNEGTLKSTGASGVIKKGQGVQIIYGPRVSVIKSNLEHYMETAPDVVIDTPAPAPAPKAEPKKETKPEPKKGAPKKSAGGEMVYAPLEGDVKTLAEVNDGVFSEEMLGKGIAIEPTVGKVVAPFDGTVLMVYTTKHAVALSSDNGTEVLIHVGLDTVKLGGKHYDVKVDNGQKVKAGDLLVEFDIPAIKAEGYPVITPVIFTDTAAYTDVERVAGDKVKLGDKLITVKK